MWINFSPTLQGGEEGEEENLQVMTLMTRGVYIYIYDISRCHGNGNQIYPVVMATGYIRDISRRHGNGGHCCGNMPGYISGIFHFWSIACMTSSLYYIQFNKCICNLTSEYSFNCGFKIFFDLSDVVYIHVVYITYNMGNRDLPDILCPRPLACGPRARAYISGKSLLPML